MTVAALVTDQSQVDELLSWGKLFANIENSSLLIIVIEQSEASKSIRNPELETSDKDTSLVKIVVRKTVNFRQQHGIPAGQTAKDQLEQDQSPVNSVSVNVLRDPQPASVLIDNINRLDVKMLLLPHADTTKQKTTEITSLESLYKRAPCETLQLQCEELTQASPINVLVAVTGTQDDSIAVSRAAEISKATSGSITALYVEPEIDSVAKQVGQKNLTTILKTSLGAEHSEVEQKVVLASNLVSALKQVDLSKYDLVIFGTRWQREVNQLFTIPTSKQKSSPIGIVAIRAKIRYTNRFFNRFQRLLERFVPQLEREQRVSLVQRIQSSSQWDFDFVALIFLSTLIAGLGLIRNSASVVIGAMLVAPLMTPIVGAGLGLAHGNIRLVKTSLRTVLRGFATAFVIGMMLGILACKDITEEMSARGTPNFLDLIVALASGIAAAYALGRPNLLSALPGVAIAAALVPPLAVSGIALARLELKLAEGSLLLFLTNIVAIILGTTVTFWAVGIRSIKKDKPTPAWPLFLLLSLVVLSIILTAAMSLPMFSNTIAS